MASSTTSLEAQQLSSVWNIQNQECITCRVDCLNEKRCKCNTCADSYSMENSIVINSFLPNSIVHLASYLLCSTCVDYALGFGSEFSTEWEPPAEVAFLSGLLDSDALSILGLSESRFSFCCCT